MTRHRDDQPASPEPLHPEQLTWAAMLAHWMDFARRAVALPDDAAGTRLREAVPDIITLQAVWFALQQLGDLPADQRALGLDRAELLINRHTQKLRDRWADEPMPEHLQSLIDDARAALAGATGGAERDDADHERGS